MDDLREKYKVVTDLWQYIKSTTPVKDVDEYWQTIVSTSNDFVKSHPEQSELAKCLMLGYLDYLESEGKRCQDRQENTTCTTSTII